MVLGFSRGANLYRALGVLLVFLWVCFCVVDVYGDGYEGDNTSGVLTSCSGFINGYQYLCGDPEGSDGGGASWHVYQVKDLNLNMLNYVGGILDYGDIDANDVKMDCMREKADWVVVYGWEGSRHKGNYNILTGPANRSGTIASAQYNSYDAKGLDYLRANNFPNNTRITSGAAISMWKRLPGKSSDTYIPSDVGYFCFAGFDNTLKVEGKNIYNNGDINDGDNSVKGIGHVSVAYKNLWNTKTYKFIGWKESSSAGTGNIVNTTSTSSAVYVSDPVSAKYDNWTKNIYQKLHIENLAADKTVYAYYAPACKLAINAGTGTTIAVDRIESPYSGASNNMANNSNLYKSDKLRVTFGLSSGYTWKSHTVGGSNFTSGDTYTVGGSGATCSGASVAAEAIRDEFEGQSRVSEVSDTWENIPDTKKKTTDWTQENGKTVVHNIQNCDPVDGCTVRFAHWLRRTAGGGSTTYSVSRTSNYYTISSGTVISTTTEDFSAPTTDSGNKRVRLEDFTNKLYPGQAVCETLTFKANVSVGNVSITACALALGDSQPKNPDGSSTLLKMEVSRDGGENYREGSIYMKPGDEVKFRATYNPVLQYTANIRPEKMQINSGSKYVNNQKPCTLVYSSSINSGYCYMYEFFNAKKGSSLQNWNNAFVLSKSDSEFKEESESEKKNSTVLQVGRYDVGDTTKRESENSYGLLNSKVSGVDAGRSMSERISTNQKEWVSRSKKIITNAASTPEQVSFTNDGDKNLGNVQTELELKAIATAYVPYNFINSTSITGIENKDNVVYAGESETVKFDVNVGMRTNNTTDGTYSTIVREASIQLIACEGIGCTNSAGSDKRVTNDDPVVLNGSGAIDGTSSDSEEMTVHIPDISAGSWMCFRSRVYPATVKNDVTVTTDWKNNDSGYGWAESEEQCYKVAKRPNFQVWGGSIYSAGKISLKESKKNNLSGVPDYPYTISGDSSQRVFGSWTELGLTAGGEVTGLASGAGTGYGKLGRVADSEDPGGSAEGKLTNYCLRSTLSFANSGCNGNGSVGGLGGSGGDASSRSALISNFVQTGDDRFDVSGDPFDLSVDDEGHLTDRGVYYYDGGSNGLVIGGGSGIESGRTKVVRTDGNVTIADNIIYKDKVGGYTALTDIPKVIIYAKGDITIQCHVERIDAVLIADGKIDTCVTAEGEYDDESNSKRLVINGSTISDTLNLNRTYGAATGANSIEPAEIINYDTSLFLWANKQADATTSGKLTETYVRELAPRY
ncbi:hypothetical protein IJG11_00445 [Candidatus Saccharibacteria bacterium]|nr:hypothetical protein [Candidatus Saccharibacteria bacterium]